MSCVLRICIGKKSGLARAHLATIAAHWVLVVRQGLPIRVLSSSLGSAVCSPQVSQIALCSSALGPTSRQGGYLTHILVPGSLMRRRRIFRHCDAPLLVWMMPGTIRVKLTQVGASGSLLARGCGFRRNDPIPYIHLEKTEKIYGW